MSNTELPEDVDDFIEEFYSGAAVKVMPLAGDASARRYYRIINKEDSAVLMHWEPFGDEFEYPFLSVHIHLARHGVLVPKVLAKDPERGIILLEDLGDLTLERKFWESQDQSLVLPIYEQALDEIIKIHCKAGPDHDPKCVAFDISFDTEKLLWEMNYGHKHLLEGFLKLDMPESLTNGLATEFQSICEHLDKLPKTLCHRDYHSRNIMLHKGRTRIIDFQDARLGPVQYDLVSLVSDSYVDFNEQSREFLLKSYLEKTKEFPNVKFDRNNFMRDYKIQSLQRCFKACGSFASFYNTREDLRYLKYIGKTLTRIQSILSEFKEYTHFNALLTDYDLMNLNYMDPTSFAKESS